MDLSAYKHTHAFEVRDHELDAQGIVNNAHYLHYFEHARHKFLNQMGLDFVTLSQQGINLVVIRVEVDYLASLRSGDHFIIASNLERVSRLRFAFVQHLFRLPDYTRMIQARVIGAAINLQGKPIVAPQVETMLAQYTTPLNP